MADVRITNVLSQTLLDATTVYKIFSILVSILFRSLFFLRFSKTICFSFLCASIFFKHTSFLKMCSFYFVCWSWPHRHILRTGLGYAHCSVWFHQNPLSCQKLKGKHISMESQYLRSIYLDFSSVDLSYVLYCMPSHLKLSRFDEQNA